MKSRRRAQSPTITLELLGAGALLINQKPIALPTRRALAILALLALEGPMTRQHLAYTLWDDLEVDNPRRNLRQELYRVVQLLPDGVLLQEDERVRLEGVQCDVYALEAGNGAGHVSRDLLQHFAVRDAPEFERWLNAQRERVKALQARWLENQCTQLETSGDLVLALNLRRQRLQLDPWNENDHRAVLRLLVSLGQRVQARQHYTELETMLREDLGIDPSPETIRLVTDLLDGTALPAVAPVLSDTLKAASLLEHAFSWATLRGVTNDSDEVLIAALDEALADGRLEVGPEGEYRFCNPQFRLQLQMDIPSGQRRFWHLRLARNLERLGASVAQVAAQFAASGERHQAATRFMRAAAMARRDLEDQIALDYYARASELFATPSQQLEALRGQVQLLEWRYQLAARAEVIAKMRDLAERSGTGFAIAALERARWQLDQGQYALAKSTAEELLEDQEVHGSDAALARFIVAAAAMRLGELTLAEELFKSVAQRARKLSSERASSHYNLALIAFTQGRLEQVSGPLEVATRIADTICHFPLQCNCAALAAAWHNRLGRYSEAKAHALSACELAVRHGLSAQQQSALQILASVAVVENDLETAEAYTKAALRLPSTDYVAGVLQITLANIHVKRGNLGEFLVQAKATIANADALAALPLRVARRAALAQVVLQCGLSDWARILATEALELGAAPDLQALAARAHLALACLELSANQAAVARQRLERWSCAEPDIELERLVFWAQACRQLGDLEAPRSVSPPLVGGSQIQELRWRIETADESQLSAIASDLLLPNDQTFETLEARSAVLCRGALPELQAAQEVDLERLAVSLPDGERSAFVDYWRARSSQGNVGAASQVQPK